MCNDMNGVFLECKINRSTISLRHTCKLSPLTDTWSMALKVITYGTSNFYLRRHRISELFFIYINIVLKVDLRD